MANTSTLLLSLEDIKLETFTLTMRLRWQRRWVDTGHMIGESHVDQYVKVLQQAWDGTRGTVKWEDVPTE